MFLKDDNFHLPPSLSMHDLAVLSPHMQQQAIVMVAQEFYQHRKDIAFEDAMKEIRNNLLSGKEKAFCVINLERVLGITSYIVYDYDQIKSQMYIEVNYSAGQLSELRLASFQDILRKKNVDQEGLPKAAGFGCSLVAQDFRGKGLARILFKRRLDEIRNNQEIGVIFAIIRGPYAQSGVSRAVMSFLLDAEEKMNGRRTDGLVKITGIWVGSTSIGNVLNIPIDSLNFYCGAPAMTKLIAESGFVPVGFFKSLSPVWATTQRALHQLLKGASSTELLQ